MECDDGLRARPRRLNNRDGEALSFLVPPLAGEGGPERSEESGGVGVEQYQIPTPISFAAAQSIDPPRKRGGIREAARGAAHAPNTSRTAIPSTAMIATISTSPR